MVSFIKEIHKKHGLKIDAEVPHEKKILVSLQDFEKGIRGHGFEVKEGRVYIPEIKKTPEFLSSDEIVMRLMLNAITSKHIFVTGNKKYYLEKRKQALENLIRLFMSAKNMQETTVNELVENIIRKNKIEHGELFLGYKDNQVIRKHLKRKFRIVLNNLANKGMMEKRKGKYSIRNKEWLQELPNEIKRR